MAFFWCHQVDLPSAKQHLAGLREYIRELNEAPNGTLETGLELTAPQGGAKVLIESSMATGLGLKEAVFAIRSQLIAR